MAYRFDAVPKALVAERRAQFTALGIPARIVDGVAGRLGEELWDDAPGSWVSEWSAEAAAAEAGGDLLLASLCFGAAKYPCLASRAHEIAYGEQLRTYLAAAPAFPLTFERRVLEVAYRGEATPVPVHVYRRPGGSSAVPVVVMLGGVDTWKMDIHPWWVGFTQGAALTTLAFDHPGTGETAVPLDEHADDVIRGLADYARTLGNGKVAHFGVSFGGNFSAMSGLSGTVDAAVDLGGPVVGAFEVENVQKLPYGMHDILGNAMHWGHSPTLDELRAGLERLNRQQLLAQRRNSAMLVVNGADDYFVPQSDTLVFQGRPKTEVHLVQGTGHCAMSKAPEVVPQIIGWLAAQVDH